MTNHSRTILVALATVTVALAGCTSDDEGDGSMSEGEQGTDSGPVELGNKGAISGLVVDDNFRPVQLKEDWGSNTPGEFQDQGFVLLLETAQRFETNENGEFKVLPLDPGSYTIRVAADNHEAIDQKVEVVAGEFAEVTLEARRQVSDGGTIFSKEQVLFMACYATAHVVGVALASVYNNGCGDLSGDSSRFDFPSDFADQQEDVRGLVTEMRASSPWAYSINARIVNGYADEGDVCDYSVGYCYFASVATDDGDYLRFVLYPDRQLTPSGEYLEDGQEGYCQVERDSECEWYAWDPGYGFQTSLFADHPNKEFIEPTCPVTETVRDQLPYGGCRGVGVALGVKAQFLQNVFLYELPDGDVEGFCALCEDADIPE